MAIYDLPFITKPDNGILGSNQLIANIADSLVTPAKERTGAEVV